MAIRFSSRFILYLVILDLSRHVALGNDIISATSFAESLSDNLKRAIEDVAKDVANETIWRLNAKINDVKDETIKNIVLQHIMDKYHETNNKIRKLESNLNATFVDELNIMESEILSKIDTEINQISSNNQDKYLNFEQQIDNNIDSKQQMVLENVNNDTEIMVTKLDTELDQLRFNISSQSFQSLTRETIVFSALLTRNVLSDGRDYITFDHVVTNVGHGYSNTAGTFTAPVDGVFMFTSVFLVDDGYVNIQLMKNGNEVVRGYAAKDVREGAGFINSILGLATGDRVGIKMIPGWITGCLRGDYYSSFSGTRVGSL